MSPYYMINCLFSLKGTVSSVPPRALGVLPPSISLVYKWGSWKLKEDSVAEEKTFPSMIFILPHAPQTPVHAHTSNPYPPSRGEGTTGFCYMGWSNIAGLLGRGKDFPSGNTLDVLRVHGYVTPYFLIQLTVCLEI